MPIVSVSRWRINPEDASRIVREVAPLLKAQGAARVTLGRIHAGQHAGQSTVVTMYDDWQAYGKAMEAQHKDNKFQQLYGQAVKSGAELQERNVLFVEEI